MQNVNGQCLLVTFDTFAALCESNTWKGADAVQIASSGRHRREFTVFTKAPKNQTTQGRVTTAGQDAVCESSLSAQIR